MGERVRAENIDIVLVEPHNAGNVGAAARALFNMGLERLVLVGWKEDAASRRVAFEWATDGEDVLSNARRCDKLEEGIGDCALAIATSARRGADRPPPLSRSEFIGLLRRWTQNNRVAIVFGPERTGLRNEHLRLCSHTLTIPTAAAPRSLNLAQAVLLVGYEIFLARDSETEPSGRPPRPLERVATRTEREQLRRHATEMLEAVGFLRPGRPKHPLDEIGWMLDRAGATAHEVQILHGICRCISWTIENRKKGKRTAGGTE